MVILPYTSPARASLRADRNNPIANTPHQSEERIVMAHLLEPGGSRPGDRIPPLPTSSREARLPQVATRGQPPAALMRGARGRLPQFFRGSGAFITRSTLMPGLDLHFPILFRI